MIDRKRKEKPFDNKEKDRSTVQALAEAYRQLAPYLNLGYVFALTVILLTLLGWYLDKKWQTSPWLTVVGAVLGIATGFYNFFRTVLQPNKKNNKHAE